MTRAPTERPSTAVYGGAELVPPPNPELAAQAQVGDYQALYRRSLEQPNDFWAQVAQWIDWHRPFTQVLDDSRAPFYRWFVGGATNVVTNALERHLPTRGDQTALIWEGEDGSVRTFSYRQLHEAVNRCANMLARLGVQRGDRVAIYMPRIPEQAIAMLATAKLGAIHTVVYGGLSREALHARIADAEAKVVITADGGHLNGKIVELKRITDAAVVDAPSVETVVCVRHAGNAIDRQARDRDWHALMSEPGLDAPCPTASMDAEDPFFIIYTSGSTGAPKGVVHTVGGYLVDVYSSLKWALDLREGDVLFCTSDAGWIVGHSIVLYGPLMHGITTIMYEGAPAYPDPGRWWRIIERHRATIFYTAPTGVRGLMRFGAEWPNKYDLSSLRLLSIAGEPLNPEAWRWYFEHIGRRRCPVIDSWWQTETARPMISNLPNLPMKPGSCGVPMPGVAIAIVDDEGRPAPPDSEGRLIITRPWPGMLRTVYKDPDRYVNQYWSQVPGAYLTGDAARIDRDGYTWVIGRVDDVIKVSGYRLGTAEVESALVSHPAVAEAAVIGLPHEVKGNAIHAFVLLRQDYEASDQLAEELRQHVAATMGPIARPETVTIVPKLPKTRSGKIMRRVLRAQALGQPLGDLSTLEE
ncbi:acetate--CoA ligase [Kallotenue papyrolyticum]|uniref:acetate--CoA ligase n=1 Tax=Kallotenue papyrolyticum TaxID=1325125 RepID=UPI0004923C6B|nr:acetate--CoA ligase [Kallotenue papyrolyticum]